MIWLVKNIKCISRLNIHYYPNGRYKSYITSLKAVIVGKSLISAWLDIDRILHFVFYYKIPKIYRQHLVGKFYGHILSNTEKFQKKWGVTPTPTPHPHTPLHITVKVLRNYLSCWMSFSEQKMIVLCHWGY